MMEYNFSEIERKWQEYWRVNKSFKTEVDAGRPKFYALDMFPYPSGAGLHVGHLLGYIASDVAARYKRIKGFNVLHPMGFDAFGLPAEQYAIQTGQHPAVTTEENINRYKKQLKNIGFSFDWDREIQTCDPAYYKWTQWIFLRLFGSWYNRDAEKSQPITELIAVLEREGNAKVHAACDEDTPLFGAAAWKAFSHDQRQSILLKYRLAFLSETTVNWCQGLMSVLSNDEVKDGFSERGGHPVEQKKMVQWSLRITAYAERLLQGLDGLDWSEPLKDMQRNWIGKSTGAEMDLKVDGREDTIRIFTTRIDTVYGLTFMVLAPEHGLAADITTDEQRSEVEAYIAAARTESERDRMSKVRQVSGVFTGAYAIHPFTAEKLPIWIADYVLAGYGTGAIMAVPGGDQRDYEFAKHFDLPIVPVFEHSDIREKADPTREGKIINEGLLKGLTHEEGIERAIDYLEEKGIGTAKVNYRLRDAIFARQRYWGEPVPIYFKDGLPYPVAEEDLPIVLPEVDKFLPTQDGAPPLARAADHSYTPTGETTSYPLELSTMPGWAGSSWYWHRYMDAQNDERCTGAAAQHYWREVDLYIGGSEHATGHLLYSRFWNKFMCDIGVASEEEPFKKLINQGMIQGRSSLVYRVKGENKFVSFGLKADYDCAAMHVDVSMVNNDILDVEAFKQWRPDLKDAEFVLEDGQYKCGSEVEKMSKRLYNVVNPDDIVEKYGADTLRMYEMFLGPLAQFKPWNTHGIDGVYKFLRKTWRLFFDSSEHVAVSHEQAAAAEQKVIHRAIKKVQQDIESLSLNTAISALMIAVNELTALKCNKREVLEKLVLILSPFAPHIAEELWQRLGHEGGISQAAYPAYDEAYLKEDSHEYPVSINGRVRTKMAFPPGKDSRAIEAEVLADEVVRRWTRGKAVKRVIIVSERIINVVI